MVWERTAQYKNVKLKKEKRSECGEKNMTKVNRRLDRYFDHQASGKGRAVVWWGSGSVKSLGLGRVLGLCTRPHCHNPCTRFRFSM